MAFASLMAQAPVQAATATANFNVTATVLKACAITTPATLAFGSYTASTGTATTGNTAFSVICTFGTPYSIGMSPGTSSGATVTTRKMTSATAPAGSNTLNYGLYKDVSLATNWDNSTAGTGYTATGVLQNYTVYGSIPAGQYGAEPATDYLDTITVTLTY